MDRNALLQKAVEARRESKYVDFKASADLAVHGDCCELVKDIVAMANAGGGVILLGGTPSEFRSCG
jgi:predicted HTH transcriptional regulator